MAARRNKRLVSMADFEEAKDKVMMGPERRSMVMSEKEKTLTAYHEAGHAIVALNVPASDPVHKATIIPRGRALGMVMQLPEGDKMSMTYQEMTSRLAIVMGGRIAEEIKFGKENVTSGAASDIQQATRLARAMVTQWGFSDEVGPVDYGEGQGEVFLGQQIVQSKSVSAETAAKIEKEVKALIETGLNEARRILTEKNADWEALSQGLLEYETLSGEEINALLRGEPPVRDTTVPPKASANDTSSGAVPVIDDDDDDVAVPGGLEPRPGPA
jgi:cell division protease FtsH